MEEMNQNNEEEVTEQRPSTKYGRTAYQQQMQEEQENTQQDSMEQDPYQGNPYQENPYQENPYQGNPYQGNPYQQNPYQQYTPYEEPKKEAKNIFANVAMALVGASSVITFILFVLTSNSYAYAERLEDLFTIVEQLVMTPGYMVLSYLSDVIFWVTVVFLVLDIVQLSKANCKITGAILFAIFLRPAYFIWRAHLLKKKKTVPIIFTVCCYLISFAGVCVVFAKAMEMAMRIVY